MSTPGIFVVHDGGTRWPACDCVERTRYAISCEGVELGTFRAGKHQAPTLYVRSIRPNKPPPAFLIPRYFPFCGEPYLREDGEVVTPTERALLTLVEAESVGGENIGAALELLIQRGLVRFAEPPAKGPKRPPKGTTSKLL